ncbi:MAG: S41 family peptidase [Saprospiraceae bacterium]
MKTRILTIIILCLALVTYAQDFVQPKDVIISKSGLQEDFKILKQAYWELHPGLFRFSTEEEVLGYFDELEDVLNNDLTTIEAFLAFSRFANKIKCGHTYTNYWNQNDDIKKLIHNKADKVPFTFDLIQNRMLITRNASDDDRLQRGVEVTSINGHSIKSIIEALLPLVKGDGSNNLARINDMQLTAFGKYEAFDIYFALLFPPIENTYNVACRNLKNGEIFTTTVQAITRGERFEILNKTCNNCLASNDEDLWQLEILQDDLAKITFGTFVTWNMKNFDWKGFIADCFKTIERKNIENVIIDIRGNGGGSDEVYIELAKYMIQETTTIRLGKSISRYDVVRDNLRPYITTWSNDFYNISKKVKPIENDFFQYKTPDIPLVMFPSRKRFKGNIYVICNAANSSATFNMATYCKRYNLATLVGQTTGGNQRGITGGRMFFLNLPNSKIELDIPLISAPVDYNIPDEGIKPDVIVERSVNDIINGIDTEVETIKTLIKSKQ